MRIAIWHNLPSGGGKRALYDHVRGLLARGHTLAAWCPPTADQGFLPLGELIPEHVLPLDLPQPARWNPTARLMRPYREVSGTLAAIDAHCRLCAEQINAGGFDLLFANSCQLVRAAPIGRYVRGPKLLYLQEPFRWLYEAMPLPPWAAPEPQARPWRPAALRARLRDELATRARRIQVREERANAAAFDRILANSLYSRESILRAYGLDATVCYLGVDAQAFEQSAAPREDYLVGLGAIVPEKNIHMAIAALGELPAPRPRLIWVGNVATPGHLAGLRRHADALGVAFEPRVGVSQAELRDALGRALALIYAPRLEPFGLAPLEAGACATPVVAVAEAGVRETVIDGVNGLLAAHEPRALAAAIGRLRADPALARRLGAGGAALVRERWSLEAAAERLELQLQEVHASYHQRARAGQSGAQK